MRKKLMCAWLRLPVFLLFAITSMHVYGQVGIGTTTPNTKAALDVRSSDKGILFPRMNSSQRDAITNPPNGLHVYNTDEGCLNFFDSTYSVWNCYCEEDTCKVIIIKITENADSINFYQRYGQFFPNAKKFVILITAGDTVKGGARVVGVFGSGVAYIYRPAFDFTTMPGTPSIKIINYGVVYGLGGAGGGGATGNASGPVSCININAPAQNGYAGGNAIDTKAGLVVKVENYGLFAGGAGGGGGGGRSSSGQYGGGGGGGAALGPQGVGGGYTTQNCSQFGCGPCFQVVVAQNGGLGTYTTGGLGGNGSNGGGNGGAGGALGQVGSVGLGVAPGLGGPVGKAINGGSGSSLINISGGISYGAVD